MERKQLNQQRDLRKWTHQMSQAHELNSTSDGVVTHQGRQDHVMYQQEVDNLHAELTLRFGASKVNRWSLDWSQMKQI